MQNEPSSSPTLSTIFRESVSVEAFDERDLEFIWSCLLPSAQADALRWQVAESHLRSGPADLFRPGRVCPISDSIRIPATAFPSPSSRHAGLSHVASQTCLSFGRLSP